MKQTGRLKRADFAALERSGRRRVHGAFFTLSISSLNADTETKYACIVSKKVASKAVERNRIKRLCREATRIGLSSSAQPRALVLHAKRAAKGVSSGELRRDVSVLLKKM